MSIALITVIESDVDNIDSDNTDVVRFFEKEAVVCFSSWRKNGGKYSNIPIYAICITKNTISERTKEKFKKLNVTYIEKYIPVTEHFTCGFWNKPLGCMMLEEMLDYETFIHIDLDMYLMKEPVVPEANSCLVYDEHQKKLERKHNDNTEVFNTCFMITKKKDEIFKKWMLVLKDIIKYTRYVSDIEERKHEELALDILSQRILIEPIEDTIFGETYSSLDTINKDKTYFHHYHIYDSISKYNWIKDRREFDAT